MLELQYITVRDREAEYPFLACIVGPDYIGSEVLFRDERQMRCFAMGFLMAYERPNPRITHACEGL